MEELQDKDPNVSRQGPDKNLSPVIDGQEYCPRCGRALQSHKCKLVCECGYFMSCSDF
jgi:ribosomal protein S27AE